jgi:hypothetical protein
MSTFLELCKDVRRECSIAGTGPTSVLNQVGELEDVVNWVKNAYIELQNEETDWRWLRSQFSIQTQASVDTYGYNAAGVTDAFTGLAITRFARWWDEELQIYRTADGVGGRHPIACPPWSVFRQVWYIGSINPGYPSMATIDPQDKLRLGAPPDGIYTFSGEYQKSPQTLAADADVPEMPAQFHQIIVARAMRKYAYKHAAAEVEVMADKIENALIDGLRASQKPVPRLGGPLA